MKRFIDMTKKEQDAVFRRQRWQIIIGFAAFVAVMMAIVSRI